MSYRNQISNLQTQHILTSQSRSCIVKRNCNGRNYAQNFVMVIITLKKYLNEKVGYHFCRVILLFRRRQKVVPLRNIKYRSNYEYFYQKLSWPLEKMQTNATGVSTPGSKPLSLKNKRFDVATNVSPTCQYISYHFGSYSSFHGSNVP